MKRGYGGNHLNNNTCYIQFHSNTMASMCVNSKKAVLGNKDIVVQWAKRVRAQHEDIDNDAMEDILMMPRKQPP